VGASPGPIVWAVRRRSKSSVASVAVGVLALVGSACGTDGDDDAATDTTESTASAPRFEGTDGAELYAAACASCHGADLRGTDRGPSHLSEVYEPSHHPDESFIAAANVGVRAHHWNFGDMPPVKGLTDEQLEAIVAYVRSVQEREGFEPYPP
jgi:mono/diheme cytochrome c family protein